MTEKLKVYEQVRNVPDNAKKTIAGGRLKGMTDINPMWRIKTLTETFGMAGIGWYYAITNKEIIEGTEDTSIAIVDINLYVRDEEGNWSMPIQGTGGSSFKSYQAKSIYVNDECYKMALTDALSVACKALGIGADVYWQKDVTKYDETNYNKPSQAKQQQKPNNYNQNPPSQANKPADNGNIKELIDKINEEAKKLARTNVEEMKNVLNEVHGSTNYTTLTDVDKANEILRRFAEIK